MPPFAGQGMCSGIRDAANLAWKLDLVLREVADADLLNTYTSERASHVQHAIEQSVALGNVICVTDPEQSRSATGTCWRWGRILPMSSPRCRRRGSVPAWDA